MVNKNVTNKNIVGQCEFSSAKSVPDETVTIVVSKFSFPICQ